MTGLAVVAAVLVGSTTFALVVARFMRVGGEKAMPTPPLPAHLNPRAAQYAEQAQQRAAKAAPGVFTALLLVLVLVGVGLVQQTFGGAA